jgi:hypothetical protein
MKQIDEFLECLFLFEESLSTLSSNQIKKLELIKNKVSEIVKKVEAYPKPGLQTVRQVQQIVHEDQIISFSDYEMLTEKILKRGSKWVVTDKSGKKVLGTHPSREKALKQLRAIEISKMRG